jgi:hypothetical protein
VDKAHDNEYSVEIRCLLNVALHRITGKMVLCGPFATKVEKCPYYLRHICPLVTTGEALKGFL